MAKKRRQYDDDDGRTIVNMNVDGMPWYDRNAEEHKKENREKITLNSEEGRAAIWGALKASLLITAIFAVAFFLFILFCDTIWFK